MVKKREKVNLEDLHPIFHSCVWRFPPRFNMSIEEKIQKCAECYASLSETTEYCEHMKRYFKGDCDASFLTNQRGQPTSHALH